MNILLLEDHPIFRFGVSRLITERWPAAIVSGVASLAEALAALRLTPFQLAITDLNLPDADGLDAVVQLLRVQPQLPLLVLSFNSEAAYAQRALKLGARGYLAKNQATIELIPALERIAAGGRYISAALAEELADLMAGKQKREPHEELSAQEFRVLQQLAAGLRVSEIAAAMHLSPKTVSTYRSRILDKLNVNSNAELAQYCVNHKVLVSPL